MRNHHKLKTVLVVIFVFAAVSCYSNDGKDNTKLPEDPLANVVEFNSNLDFAQVEFVRAIQMTDGSWRFDVTVRHKDEGWDHYADLWEVVDPETGDILAERELAHPHDTEQPFTRSQYDITIPTELSGVVVRSKCTDHGYGGKAILVDFAFLETEEYEIVL